MANTGFLYTTAGLAAASTANPGGPYLHVTQFKVGSAFNYNPTVGQTDLQGSTLYTGTPTSYTIVDQDTVECTLIMPVTAGDFDFGEVGVYLEDGTALAFMTFDTQQEKRRAVGNQAGNIWRVRARLTLTQAPAIVQCDLINGQNILEVPHFENLLRPDNQPNDQNIAIVHDEDVSVEPILAIRDGNTQWGLIGYYRMFLEDVGDAGASATPTTLTHPTINDFRWEGLPTTRARYVVKNSVGDMRIIVSRSGDTVTVDPPFGTTPTGTFSVHENIASMIEGLKNQIALNSPKVGTIIWYGDDTVPDSRTLECKGQTLSRTAWPELFAVFGERYGAGDGSTTFKNIDLRGAFIRGWDHNKNRDPDREFGTYQVDAFKAHDHLLWITGSGTQTHNNQVQTGLPFGAAQGDESTQGDMVVDSGGVETRPKNIALLPCVIARTGFEVTDAPPPPPPPPSPEDTLTVTPSSITKVYPQSVAVNEQIATYTPSGAGTASLVSGTLPTGMSITVPGTLSVRLVGTPTSTGTFTSVVRITTGTNTDTFSLSVRITASEVLISNQTASNVQNIVGPATALYRLKNDGVCERSVAVGFSNSINPVAGQWLVAGSAASFEVRATVLTASGWASGPPTTGTVGTWQALSTTRTWTYEDSTVRYLLSEAPPLKLKIEIRDAGSLVVMDTATITLISCLLDESSSGGGPD